MNHARYDPDNMQDTNLTPLNEASKWFPLRGGKPLGPKALRRRIRNGSRGVRLRAIKDGGEWFTCREWVEDYLSAVTAAALAPVKAVRVAPAKSSERAKRRLARRYGIHAAK